MIPTLADQLAQLPQHPGVYQFFNSDGHLLYIGKATSLRQRVRSYFQPAAHHSPAKALMVSKIASLEITLTDNPAEALLLETTLIKKYRPPYNVVMKDDKNFLYIHITDEVFPRILTVRRLPLRNRQGTYFGPYTSGGAVQRSLRLLKRIFRYCEQPPLQKNGVLHYPKRPCLDYHLGRCVGPCAKAVTPDGYSAIIDQVSRFLRGDYEAVETFVRSQMEEAANQQQFEQAARWRDQLQAIDHLRIEQKMVSTRVDSADYFSLARLHRTGGINVFTVRRGMLVAQHVFFVDHINGQSDDDVLQAFVDQYYAHTDGNTKQYYVSCENRRGRHRKLLELGTVNAAEALQRRLASFEKAGAVAQAGLAALQTALGLPKPPQRIEIYDISNNQGNHTVASMVVFIDGQPARDQYRKFTIRTVEGPNDFASMREVINRRIKHVARSGRAVQSPWPTPDVIIIDGGKGQLSAAMSMITAAKLQIPVVSLAKREEELFVPHTTEPIRLAKGSDGYHFVQRMRDEAHRFAITFYRARHRKALTQK